MKTKKVIVLALLLTLCCSLFNVNAFAAETNTAETNAAESEALKFEVYVKQSRQLTVLYWYKVLDPHELTWKVTSGSNYISVNKDGIVTGKKAGSGVITATYKGQSIKFDITVKKAPKAKAKTYKIDGTNIKLPKGLVRTPESDPDEYSFSFGYVKDDTNCTVSVCDAPNNLKDITKKQFDSLWDSYLATSVKELTDSQINSAKTFITAKGFTVSKDEVVSEKRLSMGYKIMYKITPTTERPIYALITYAFSKGKMISFIVSSNSKKNVNTIANYIIKKNGLK